MRQLVVGLALLALFAFVAVAPNNSAVAQKDAKAPHIDVTEGKDGKYRFTVRSGEGKLLAMSGPTGYVTEKDAHKAIDDLKTALKTAKVMPTKKSSK
jgi:uncharacterized protein YegP (UPF0339 family)